MQLRANMDGLSDVNKSVPFMTTVYLHGYNIYITHLSKMQGNLRANMTEL